MKKIIFAILLFATFVIQDAAAQTRKKTVQRPPSSSAKKNSAKSKAREDEVNFWKEKMMYGSFINYPTLGNGFFNMALSPMAAYKVNKSVVAGLIGKVSYTWLRGGAAQAPLQVVDLGGGAFARAKFFNVIFLHGELERTQFSFIDLNQPKGIGKIAETSGRIGLGYLSGSGIFKPELGVYYNLMWKDQTKPNPSIQENPWDFRFGFTYNF